MKEEYGTSANRAYLASHLRQISLRGTSDTLGTLGDIHE